MTASRKRLDFGGKGIQNDALDVLSFMSPTDPHTDKTE